MTLARSLRLKRYSPRTIRLYTGTIKHLDAWLRERGASTRTCTVDQLLDYADTLPFTYASRQRLINAYKAYWRHHLGRRGDCPSESIPCPRKPKQIYRGLESPEDARLLVKHAGGISTKAKAACALLYFSGLRCEETASLPWAGDEGAWIHVMGKGAQPRRIPTHDDLRAILDLYRAGASEESPFVLPGRYSPQTHVSTQTVYMWVRLAGASAGLGHVTPHMLRYTYGGQINDETGDLRATAELLGHAPTSLSVTMGYSRTRMVRLREAIATL